MRVAACLPAVANGVAPDQIPHDFEEVTELGVWRRQFDDLRWLDVLPKICRNYVPGMAVDRRFDEIGFSVKIITENDGSGRH